MAGDKVYRKLKPSQAVIHLEPIETHLSNNTSLLKIPSWIGNLLFETMR
jgi:hypothetical protein